MKQAAFIFFIMIAIAGFSPAHAQDMTNKPEAAQGGEFPPAPAPGTPPMDLEYRGLNAEPPAMQETRTPAESAAGHEGGEHKKGLPQFDPSSYPGQIFWLVITFAFLYVFFSRKTLPEIGQVLQAREQHIQNNLDTAQKLREKAEQEKASWEKIVAQTQEKASAFYVEAEEEIRKKTAIVMEDLRVRTAKQIEVTESQIEKSKKEALESIHTVAAEIASLAARKIVGISTDLDQAKTVIRNLNKKAA